MQFFHRAIVTDYVIFFLQSFVTDIWPVLSLYKTGVYYFRGFEKNVNDIRGSGTRQARRNARYVAQVLSGIRIAATIIDRLDNGESWAGAGEGITRSCASTE